MELYLDFCPVAGGSPADAIRRAADGNPIRDLIREVEQGKVPDPEAAFLDYFLAEARADAIRRAADGNQGALTYLFRDFIREVEQGKAPDPGVALVVAHVLKRFLNDGEDIDEILGTQARRGRRRAYKSAIKVHATVRTFMLDKQRSGRTQRRGDDTQAAAAEALGMSLNTVRENYKRVQKLIKKLKDEDSFFDLGRVGVSPIEEAYLIDPEPENAVFLLDWMSRNPNPQIGDNARVSPPRTALGRRIVYRREGVMQWLRAREIEEVRGPTSSAKSPNRARGRIRGPRH